MADLNNVVTVLEDILTEFRELNSKVSALEEKFNSIEDSSTNMNHNLVSIKTEVQKIDKDMLSMERYLQGLLMKY